MALLKAVLTVAVLVLGIFFLVEKDNVFFLQSYEGRVVRAYQDAVGNADGRINQPHMMQLRTEQGEREIEIPMSYYRDMQPGVRVKKRMFSNRIDVLR